MTKPRSGLPRNDKRVNDVMRVIEKWFALYGKPPSIRQIMKETDITSTFVTVYYIRKLVEEGYITYNPTRGRYGKTGIRLTKKRMFT